MNNAADDTFTVQDPPTKNARAKAQGERRGLVIVNTGNGKGKTTAALGLLMRAQGRGLKTMLFQFIKHASANFGEHRSLDLLSVPHKGLGDGFSWRSQDLEKSAALAYEGWLEAKEAILAGELDMIVLDEVTYPLNWGWVPLDEVLETLQARPKHQHVILTGRDAPAALQTYADTVTEMRQIKHAFDADIPAQRGIEH